MASLQVTVVSRSEELYQGEAEMVSAPSSEGSLGILPGRSPVLATMTGGTIRIQPTGGKSEVTMEVGPGFISVDSDHVMIVVDAL